MKLSKHSDGTYSFTDMTGEDVRNLAGGLSAAAAHRAQWSGMTAQDIAWAEANREAADTLWYVLHAMTESASKGSIVVTSPTFGGGPEETPYLVEKVNGIRGWNDRPDITSHLKRKAG